MEAGRVLADRYELTERLGRGGMAEVFRATDRALGREVAVKVLLPHRAQDDSFVRRFEREARSAASLNHPNIVAIHDTGSDGDERYIVMELVEGPTLEEVIAERSPMAADEVVAVTEQVCAALEAAHGAGLVHRDIKPGNIMFDRSGTVKVTDFGIAKATAEASLTETGSVYGSAPYLAPEQARGGDVDHRADLYALGCVVYAMLVGEAPFTGTEPMSVIYQHLHTEVDPPSARREGIDPGLDAVVLGLLAKDPSERYADAAQVSDDLQRVDRGREPVAADLAATQRLHEDATRRMDASDEETRVLPGAAAGGAAASATAAAEEPGTDEDDGGSRWRNAGVIAVGAAVLVALLLALTMFTSDPPSEGASPGSPSPTPALTPSATPAPPGTLEAAVFALYDVVNQGLQQGELTQKAADELGKVGNEALKAYREGDIDKALEKVEEGRAKVSELTSQGEIEPERAELILAAIDEVEALLQQEAPPPEGDGEDDDEGGGPPDDPPGEGRGRGNGD